MKGRRRGIGKVAEEVGGQACIDLVEPVALLEAIASVH